MSRISPAVRLLVRGLLGAVLVWTAGAAGPAPIKIGVLWAYTLAGSSSSAGPQLDAAIATFQRDHGTTIAGHPVDSSNATPPGRKKRPCAVSRRR